MKLHKQLIKLAHATNQPSVTISLNTHRTHPDSEKDKIMLKNLLAEAGKRIIKEYGKRDAGKLLGNLENVEKSINVNYNLDSLHIFVSGDTSEIVRLALPTTQDRVYIADQFDLRTLIKAVNRTEDYLILLLSQGGVNLYHAMNDSIVKEITDDNFPFEANPYYTTDKEKQSDPKQMDDFVREYFNNVDKAVVKISREKDMECVVIATEDNYAYLRQVADNPAIYIGFSAIDYHKTKEHQIAEQAWEVVKKLQKEKRTQAITEIKEAVGNGKVYTDLNDIYAAALEGRGELLIVREDYSQAINLTKDNRPELADDPERAEIDDITSTIAWEVISKNGRAFFTCQEEIKELGNMVLKTRY